MVHEFTQSREYKQNSNISKKENISTNLSCAGRNLTLTHVASVIVITIIWLIFLQCIFTCFSLETLHRKILSHSIERKTEHRAVWFFSHRVDISFYFKIQDITVFEWNTKAKFNHLVRLRSDISFNTVENTKTVASQRKLFWSGKSFATETKKSAIT